MFVYLFCLLIGGAQCTGTRQVRSICTLDGECPNLKIQENLDGARFSGIWYDVASYASDNRTIKDCTIIEFQEDNMGFTMKETFVDFDDPNGNRTQKSYLARVDPTFDAENRGKFIISHENGDKVLQFPLHVLTTDYEDYAILFTCKNKERKAGKHYMFIWVLTRSKDVLEGDHLKKIDNALSKFPALTAHRNLFVFKDFSEKTCAFNKQEIDSFSTSYWK